MKLSIRLSLFLFLISSSVFSQGEFSSFNLTGHGLSTVFATDYQCLGINPANTSVKYSLENDKRFALGTTEMAFSLHSGILTKDELWQNVFQKGFKNLTRAEQISYAQEFAKNPNALDLDLMTFGFSMNLGKFGSIALGSRERMDAYVQLGSTVSDIMWLGSTASYFSDLVIDLGNGNYDTIANMPDLSADTLNMVIEGISNYGNSNLAQLLDGTRIHYSWLREFNLSYSRPIFETEFMSLYAGVGAKYLVGQGFMDIYSDGLNVTANAAFSPVFQIPYDSLGSNISQSQLEAGAKKLTPVGRGYALDFGATWVFKKFLFVSASVTDLGKMKWDANAYQFSNQPLTSLVSQGMPNVNMVQNLSAINLGGDIVSWSGKSSFETKLPSTMRAGAGINLMNKVKLGIDLVAPLNHDISNLQKGMTTVGGEVTMAKRIKLSMAVIKGGNYNVTRISGGIAIQGLKGKQEFGIASRDLITYFTEENPTISMAIGFARWKF